MRSRIQMLAALILFVTPSLWAWGPALEASKCRYDNVTAGTFLRAAFLGEKVRSRVKEIENEYAERGENLDVVLVARIGISLDKTVVLKSQDLKAIYTDVHPPFEDIRHRKESRQREIRRKYASGQVLKYSHVGIYLKDDPLQINGEGEYIMKHLLTPCPKKFATAYVYTEGAGVFFMDDPSQWGAKIIVPNKEIREYVKELLLNQDKVLSSRWDSRFKPKKYNIVATWNDPVEGNSNQWVLEVLAAALWGRELTTREEAQQVLGATGYLPTPVMLTDMLSSLYGMGRALGLAPKAVYVDTRKQPYLLEPERLAHLNTFDALQNWMGRNQMIDKMQEIFLDASEVSVGDGLESTRLTPELIQDALNKR